MPAKRFLYLVRHGQHRSESDDGGRQIDGGLTGLGEEQARLLGARLSRLPIRSIVTSNLPRAVQTATLVRAAGLDGARFVETSMLREFIPGVPADYDRPLPSVNLVDIAQGTERGDRVFGHWFRAPDGPDEHVALVCHGNIIRYLVCRTLAQPTENWVHLEIHNASLTLVTVTSGERPRLVSFNDVGHLPLEKTSQ